MSMFPFDNDRDQKVYDNIRKKFINEPEKAEKIIHSLESVKKYAIELEEKTKKVEEDWKRKIKTAQEELDELVKTSKYPCVHSMFSINKRKR